MLRILVFCGLLLVSSLRLWAQEGAAVLQPYKLAMMRAAVDFYATDTAAFHLHDARAPCPAANFKELVECAKGLTGVDLNLKRWDASRVSDTSALRKLGDQIISDIANTRKVRTQFSNWPSLNQTIREINVAARQQFEAAAPPLVEDGDTTQHVQGAEQTPPSDVLPIASWWEDARLWSGLAVVVSLVALGMGIVQQRKRDRRRKAAAHSSSSFSGAKTADTAVLEQLNRVNARLNTLERQVQHVEEFQRKKFRDLEARDADDQNLIREQTDAFLEAAAVPQAPAKKWAKYPDGGAFDVDALSDQPDKQMVYELVFDGPDSASFRVSERKDAQRFALSNSYLYLGKACTYEATPGPNSRIHTDKPGRLELEGRRWKIKTMARISFT